MTTITTTVRRCLILLAMTLCHVAAASAQPSRLEFLDLGPLKLMDLKPGTLTILDQKRIIGTSVHRRFRLKATSGRFTYLKDGVNVLSGRVYKVDIEGYIYFSAPDNIGSMIVEKKDDFTFILEHETYSLPTYGGGGITLVQKQVWVGNSTPIDLLNRTGQIYFRTASVDWKGIRATLEKPAAQFSIDAVAEDPEQGVKFVFDLATARLSLQEGQFRSVKISPVPSAPSPGSRARLEIADVTGPLRLTVSSGTAASSSGNATPSSGNVTAPVGSVAVSAAKLDVRFRSAALGEDDVPTAAAGVATLTKLSSEARFDEQRLEIKGLGAASGSFAPDAGMTSRDAAWALPPLAALLNGLGLSEPAAIRQQAITEARQTIGSLGTDLAFASVKRSLIETLVRKRLAELPAVTLDTLEFGPQSVLVSATVTVSVPFAAKPLRFPLDAEVTFSVKDSTLLLRPVGRMLLLGKFTIPSALTLESAIETLRAKLFDAMSARGLGFVEFALPLDLVPRLKVDPAQLGQGPMKVTGEQVELPLALRPVVVVRPENLWILSEVKVR